MVSTVGTKAYKPVARFANPALRVAFLWSAALNAIHSTVLVELKAKALTAASLGASIPGLIYAGTCAWANWQLALGRLSYFPAQN